MFGKRTGISGIRKHWVIFLIVLPRIPAGRNRMQICSRTSVKDCYPHCAIGFRLTIHARDNSGQKKNISHAAASMSATAMRTREAHSLSIHQPGKQPHVRGDDDDEALLVSLVNLLASAKGPVSLHRWNEP